MELEIMAGGKPLGKAQILRNGLYWSVKGELFEINRELYRLYAVHELDVEYLGIFDPSGRLSRRLPVVHMPAGPERLIASSAPRLAWLPWCGRVDGVDVAEGFLQRAAGDLLLALPPQEAVKFPQWIDTAETVRILDRDYALFRLTEDGRLPLREKESRGMKNETDIVNPVESVLSADSAAAVSISPGRDADAGGAEGGAEEARCSDL